MTEYDPDGSKPDVECPTCGREDFKNRHGMRIHHHAKHGSSLLPEEEPGPECPTCGRNDFASVRGMKCHHASVHEESIAGEVVECEWCGKEKRVQPIRYENYNKFFCSPAGDSCHSDCERKWLSLNRTGDDNPLYKGEEQVECAWCGTQFGVSQWHAEHSENHFCPTEDAEARSVCYSEWITANRTGVDNPTWCGGSAHLRRIILSHIDSRSWTHKSAEQRSSESSCALCGSGDSETLDAHHIVPVLAGGVSADELLMTLCTSCHASVESFTDSFCSRVIADIAVAEAKRDVTPNAVQATFSPFA